MNIEHIILGLLWILYCFIHSLLASDSIRLRIEGFFKAGRNSYRLGYNIFAVLSLAALLLYHFSLPGFILFRILVINGAIATVLIVAGIILMIICIRKYFFQLSGLGMQTPGKPVLEKRGIHRYVRHPLYLGTFIFLSGIFLKYPLLSNLMALTIIIIYTVIGIQIEERKLVKTFGDDYIEYQKEVPMLFPFLK